MQLQKVPKQTNANVFTEANATYTCPVFVQQEATRYLSSSEENKHLIHDTENIKPSPNYLLTYSIYACLVDDHCLFVSVYFS